MILEWLAITTLALASIPAIMALVNLTFYRPPRSVPGERSPVSVLIPARDEEASIEACVEAALASEGVELEVVVLDDHSRDATPEIVRALAERDSRVRLISAPPLPAGWCGKQHACHRLSEAAAHPVLAFVDADVRLAPEGLKRLLGFLERSRAGLISGIPRQRTDTMMEKLVVPLIHFILLGFLPFAGMRWSRLPAFAAGCGQLFVAHRNAYKKAGGHASIRSSRHDGVTLPRAFRHVGEGTDLCDATGVAECRMYRSAGEVWRGFAKNADEGMATPAAIGPWTLLLGGGQVLPPVLLVIALLAGSSAAAVWAGIACLLAWSTRALMSARFRQSWLGAALHPAGVAVVLAIQWFALFTALRGRQVEWKGRVSVNTPARGSEA